MDEEGHLKIADFGLAMDDMWLGEKIEEDWETGTPSFIAPEVCLISSLENEKLSEIIASDSGYGMIGAKIWIVPHGRVYTPVREHASTRAQRARDPTRKIRLYEETRLMRGDLARVCVFVP